MLCFSMVEVTFLLRNSFWLPGHVIKKLLSCSQKYAIFATKKRNINPQKCNIGHGFLCARVKTTTKTQI